MKISDLMTPDPVTCLPTTNLAQAAALMLQGDCGILPVVENGKILRVRIAIESETFELRGVIARSALEHGVGPAAAGHDDQLGPKDFGLEDGDGRRQVP